MAEYQLRGKATIYWIITASCNAWMFLRGLPSWLEPTPPCLVCQIRQGHIPSYYNRPSILKGPCRMKSTFLLVYVGHSISLAWVWMAWEGLFSLFSSFLLRDSCLHVVHSLNMPVGGEGMCFSVGIRNIWTWSLSAKVAFWKVLLDRDIDCDWQLKVYMVPLATWV